MVQWFSYISQYLHIIQQEFKLFKLNGASLFIFSQYFIEFSGISILSTVIGSILSISLTTLCADWIMAIISFPVQSHILHVADYLLFIVIAELIIALTLASSYIITQQLKKPLRI